MPQHALFRLVALLLTAAFVALSPAASADELAPNPYGEDTSEPTPPQADADTLPPVVPNRVVAPRLRVESVAEHEATDVRLEYESGTRLQGTGIALGLVGAAATFIGTAIFTSHPTKTVCSPDYAGAFAADLGNAIEGGGADYEPAEPEVRCGEEPDRGTELAGLTVAAVGVGALVTGVILGVVGTGRRRDAVARGFDPDTLVPWVSPTGDGAVVGVTMRR